MEELLKAQLEQYLDEQAEKDSCFAEKYNKSMLGGLVKYVMAKAKKALNGINGCIANEVVYKWARDYFNDGICEKELKEKIERNLKKIEREEKKESIEDSNTMVSEAEQNEREQLDLFS